jgi:low affinity Fe/Cu permease
MPRRSVVTGGTSSRVSNSAAALRAKERGPQATRSDHRHDHTDLFTRFAHCAAVWAGNPATFLVAAALIIGWAASGPAFGFSDTWQLIVNTATTVVTFLMVFLIQSTQNRDTRTLQLKLDELIIAVRGAHNQLAAAEDMSDAELDDLQREYRRRADAALDSLKERRSRRN